MNKIRLSHSALDLLNTCERKFQLDRFLTGGAPRQDYPPTVFGKAFGAGIADYLAHQNRDQAIMTTWLAYTPKLEDARRTELVCVNAVINAFTELDNLLLDYEPVLIEGKVCDELSFRLNIDEQFYYVGYIDFILKNRFTGRYVIIEVKTTGLSLHDLDPLYINSGQAVGYSIVLDKIAGATQSEYDVIYIIGQIGSGNGFQPNIQVKTFPKTIGDRLNWFLSIGMDKDRIHQMLELDYFPKRGASCLKYNKPCPHLGTCGLTALDEMRKEEEDTIDYDFTYELNDIITDHIKRIS